MMNREEPKGAASPSRVGAILAAVVLAAVAVFSLGVMVGKRGAGNVAPLVEPPTSLPTETLAPPPAPVSEMVPAAKKPPPSETLTFFDTLSGDKASAPPPRPSPSSSKAPPKAAARQGGSKTSDRIDRLKAPGRYRVQVASSPRRAWADEMRVKLNKQGIDSVVDGPVTIKGKTWFRIRVGPFASKAEAAKARDIFEKELDIKSMVVSDD